jgi:O-acetyl-ADP-ribose deacetylase (regulator of RNase III)
MIKFQSGDILDSKCHALVNTVNTVGIIGKGVALQFKHEFPHNFTVYRNSFIRRDLRIGQLLTVQDCSTRMGERIIINFPTKTHWRLPSEYSYVEQGLKSLAILIPEKALTSIAIPALGCGNGGLDWIKIKDMIEQHLASIEAYIEIYEPV